MRAQPACNPALPEYSIMLFAGSELLPDHRLTRLLGKGAFGEVWEAVTADNNVVALKFMDCRSKPLSIVSSEIRVLRGLSELHHPNIIRLHAVHAVSQYIVLSMERADGNLNDLRQAYLEETGRNVPIEHALELLGQAAAALDFLAEVKLPSFNQTTRGLQHCDIKPANLLLLGDQLKIGDFGLCAGASWQMHKDGWRGTPPYAAPELYRGPAQPGTDQFALAVTYCQLCFGERTFFHSAFDPAAPPAMPIDLTRIREREVPILSRALNTHPSVRFPSCTAFIDALRTAALSPRRSPQPITSPLRPYLLRQRV
jgi:serine/threonine protein kinase